MKIIINLYHIFRLKYAFKNWSTEKIIKHQNSRIRKLLKIIEKKSSFYNDIYKSRNIQSIHDLPLMTKEIMMENFNKINTVGLDRNSLIEFKIDQERKNLFGLYKKFSIGLSSGTSGNKCLTVLSPKERNLYSCLLWARKGHLSQIRHHKILFAIRTNNPAYTSVSKYGVYFHYIDYTRSIESIINIINTEKLNIIAGPVSMLKLIAENKSLIDSKIEAVVSYAEVLSKYDEELLESVFGVPISQIYQGAEGFIASTCRHGKLHLNEDAIFFEFEEIQDGLKNIIITDLYRTSQPFIRYKLNDVLELSDEPCSCGSNFKVIKAIHGRVDDLFLLKTSAGKIRYLFSDYVRRSINQASDQILEYQAIQNNYNHIEIRLKLKSDSNTELIKKTILSNLNFYMEKIGVIPVSINFSDIEPEKNTRSNKLIRVIRNFKK
ncbi:MAG: hypothetical protein JW982_04965 [Spirochaetes bacterium]|nr:hypothetical protein [Spirochaetota bacterium]